MQSQIKLITGAPVILAVDRLNRIKVVSEVAELVPILRAVDSDVKAEVFREVSAGWMTVREIEAKFGEEGANAIRFFEKMKLVETKWQTGPTASPEKAYHAFYSSFHINATAPIQEISDVLHAAMMSDASGATSGFRPASRGDESSGNGPGRRCTSQCTASRSRKWRRRSAAIIS